MLEIVAALLEALLLALVYALLGWLFPREARQPGEALTPARRRAMQQVYAVGNFAVLGLAIPGTWLAYRGLETLARAWLPSGDHVLVAGWIFWALPALFLGILIGGFLVEAVLRLRLGEGYRDLKVVMADHLGSDPTRAGLAVSAVVLTIVAGLVWIFLQLHFVLDGDDLRLSWPFAEPVRVKASEVRWIREYRPGRYREGQRTRTVEEGHFRLAYGPGDDDWWKSTEFQGPAGISDEVRAAVEALAGRAGVTIERPEPVARE
jgi:hypothetical protein